MSNPAAQQPQRTDNRADLRLLSHTIVDVRPFKHIPVLTQSSFLIDISASGVLLEFVTPPNIKAGKRCWAITHLTPLGITTIRKFKCHLECRWMNKQTCRMGALFLNLSEKDKQIIELILHHIREKSKNR